MGLEVGEQLKVPEDTNRKKIKILRKLNMKLSPKELESKQTTLQKKTNCQNKEAKEAQWIEN